MSDERRIYFPPDVQGTIAATRCKKLGWLQILGELIDNAFDAGATRVEIARDGRELTVSDDGTGCDDFEKMLTMGRHHRNVTTRLGRYGVGFKDAAWWVGGPTMIETVHAGKIRRCRLDWDRMSDWSTPDPFEVPDADGKVGTRIRFEAMSKDRRFPDGKELEERLAEIAFTYSPAIKHGRQIVFRAGRKPPTLLQRYELPQLTDVVDATISVDGKSARVYVGIVPEGVPNPNPGISYTHAFRVITHSALGCGGLGSARIAGWVALGDGWTLARNKDDVTAYKDELGEAVFDVIRAIVAKASGQALSMRSVALSSHLTSLLRGQLAGAENDAKAKRAPAKNPTGPKLATGAGGKHTKARRSQRGATFRETRPGEFRIDFRPLTGDALGSVDLDGRVIWLNDSHPTVAEAKSTENRMALSIAAAFLFATRDCDNPTSLLTICRDGTLAREVEMVTGRLLAEMHRMDIAGLKAVA